MVGHVLRALVAFGVVAMLSALGGAHWARSQASFPEGAFVVAQDGTRWVVGGGSRYRMSFVLDDANAIPALRESNIAVATVAEAAAALAGGSVAGVGVAPAPSPPAPATPAATLVGQSVATCFGSQRFIVAVDRTGWQRTAGGRTAPGNAMWAVVVVNVTNDGTVTGIGGNAQSAVELVDNRGRTSTSTSDVAFLGEVAAEFMSQQPYISISPGVTDQMVFVFQMPPDASTLTLRAAPFQCTL